MEMCCVVVVWILYDQSCAIQISLGRNIYEQTAPIKGYTMSIFKYLTGQCVAQEFQIYIFEILLKDIFCLLDVSDLVQ